MLYELEPSRPVYGMTGRKMCSYFELNHRHESLAPSVKPDINGDVKRQTGHEKCTCLCHVGQHEIWLVFSQDAGHICLGRHFKKSRNSSFSASRILFFFSSERQN